MWKVVTSFLILVALVVGLSAVSSRLWGGKPEGAPEAKELILKESMTVGQFAKANDLPPKMMKKVFGLKSPSDMQKPVSPVKAISFKSGRRGRPPEGKFNVADGGKNQQ